jgi:hypothetical protein
MFRFLVDNDICRYVRVCGLVDKDSCHLRMYNGSVSNDGNNVKDLLSVEQTTVPPEQVSTNHETTNMYISTAVNINILNQILTIICHECEVKHIMMLPIKTITSVLKVSMP